MNDSNVLEFKFKTRYHYECCLYDAAVRFWMDRPASAKARMIYPDWDKGGAFVGDERTGKIILVGSDLGKTQESVLSFIRFHHWRDQHGSKYLNKG